MCLRRIIKERVLSKNLRVFRLVMVGDRGLVSPYKVYPVDAGCNEVVERAYIQCEDDGSFYPAGFHCYAKRKYAKSAATKYTSAFCPHGVLLGIIPAGTSVILGACPVSIIVTPVLFHKEEDYTKLRNQLIKGAYDAAIRL